MSSKHHHQKYATIELILYRIINALRKEFGKKLEQGVKFTICLNRPNKQRKAILLLLLLFFRMTGLMNIKRIHCLLY